MANKPITQSQLAEVVTGDLLDHIGTSTSSKDPLNPDNILKKYEQDAADAPLELIKARRRNAINEQLRQETAARIDRETDIRAAQRLKAEADLPYPDLGAIRAANPEASSDTIDQIFNEQMAQRDHALDVIRRTSASEINSRLQYAQGGGGGGVLTPTDSFGTKVKNFFAQGGLGAVGAATDIMGDGNTDFGKRIKQAQEDAKTAHEIDVGRKYNENELKSTGIIDHLWNYVTNTTAGDIGKFTGTMAPLIAATVATDGVAGAAGLGATGATLATAGTTGLVSGLQFGNQAADAKYNEIMSMSRDQLANYDPNFKKVIRKHGGDLEAAREELATQGSRLTGVITGLIAASGAAALPVVSKFLTPAALSEAGGAAAKGAFSRAKPFFKRVAADAVVGGMTNMGMRIAPNISDAYVKGDYSKVLDGAGNAFAEGAVLGAPFSLLGGRGGKEAKVATGEAPPLLLSDMSRADGSNMYGGGSLHPEPPISVNIHGINIKDAGAQDATNPATATGEPINPATATGEPINPATATGEPLNPATATGEPLNPATATGEPINPATATGEPINPATATGEPINPATVTGAPINPATATGEPINPATATGEPINPATATGEPISQARSAANIAEQDYNMAAQAIEAAHIEHQRLQDSVALQQEAVNKATDNLSAGKQNKDKAVVKGLRDTVATEKAKLKSLNQELRNSHKDIKAKQKVVEAREKAHQTAKDFADKDDAQKRFDSDTVTMPDSVHIAKLNTSERLRLEESGVDVGEHNNIHRLAGITDLGLSNDGVKTVAEGIKRFEKSGETGDFNSSIHNVMQRLSDTDKAKLGDRVVEARRNLEEGRPISVIDSILIDRGTPEAIGGVLQKSGHYQKGMLLSDAMGKILMDKEVSNRLSRTDRNNLRTLHKYLVDSGSTDKFNISRSRTLGGKTTSTNNEVLGSYTHARDGEGTATLSKDAQASVLSHEALHAITAQAYDLLRENNPTLYKNLSDLLQEIRNQVVIDAKRRGVDTANIESVSNTNHATLDKETMAELFSPDLLATMRDVEFDPSTLSEGAKSLYDTLKLGGGDVTAKNIFTKAVKWLTSFFQPDNGNLALGDILGRTIDHILSNDGEHLTQPSSIREETLMSQRYKTSEQEQKEQLDKLKQALDPNAKPLNANEKGMDYVKGVFTGANADGSGVGNVLDSSFLGSRRNIAMRVYDNLSQRYADGNYKIKMLANRAIGTGGITKDLVKSFVRNIDSMFGRKDYVLKGLETLTSFTKREHDILKSLSEKYPEDGKAKEQLGLWIAAKASIKMNEGYIKELTETISNLKQKMAEATTEKQRTRLETEIKKQQNTLDSLRTGFETGTKDGDLKGGRVAGYPKAMAEDIMKTIESVVGKDKLKDLQDGYELYTTMNAYSLMTDVRSGYTPPEVAAKLSGKPQLVSMYNELLRYDEASRKANTTAEQKEAHVQLLKDILKESRTDYIPLNDDMRTSKTSTGGGGSLNLPRTYENRFRKTITYIDGTDNSYTGFIRATDRYAKQTVLRDLNTIVTKLSAATASPAFHVEMLHENSKPVDGSVVYRYREKNEDTGVYEAKAKRIVFADKDVLNPFDNYFNQTNGFLLSNIGKLTRGFSMAATQLNPLFAPKQYVMDGVERVFNLTSQELTNVDGGKVNGNKVAMSAANNLVNPVIASEMFRTVNAFFKGDIDFVKYPMMGLVREMEANGALSSRENILTTRDKRMARSAQRKGGITNLHKDTFSALMDLSHRWNGTQELVTQLGVFKALRDHGLSPEDASQHTLNTFNYTKRGANMNTVRSLYAFAQAAVTGGVNTMEHLYDPVTGKVKPAGVVKLGAMALGLFALKAMIGGVLGDDENGAITDQVSDYDKENNILLPFNDGWVKIPVGFGITRVANMVANTVYDGFTGNDSASTLLAKGIGGLIPTLTPFDAPQVDAVQHPLTAAILTFSPSVLKPVAQIYGNTNTFGQSIVHEGNNTMFNSDKGYNVAPLYTDIAQEVRKMTGNTIDMNPNYIKTFFDGIPLGVLTTAKQMYVDNPYKESVGKPTSSPLIKAFYTTRNTTAWLDHLYQGVQSAESLEKEVNAYNSAPPSVRSMMDNPSNSAQARRTLDWYSEYGSVSKSYSSQLSDIKKSSVSDEMKAQLSQKLLASKAKDLQKLMQDYNRITGVCL